MNMCVCTNGIRSGIALDAFIYISFYQNQHTISRGLYRMCAFFHFALNSFWKKSNYITWKLSLSRSLSLAFAGFFFVLCTHFTHMNLNWTGVKRLLPHRTYRAIVLVWINRRKTECQLKQSYQTEYQLNWIKPIVCVWLLINGVQFINFFRHFSPKNTMKSITFRKSNLKPQWMITSC